ncbi:hypothetical protein HK096_005115, partial [Nowakowskiella sp. JEL0078]
MNSHASRPLLTTTLTNPALERFLSAILKTAHIPETAAKPFNPTKVPYTTWLNGSLGAAFRADNSVVLATRYFDTGIVPSYFSWLQDIQVDEKRDEKKKKMAIAGLVSSIGTSERIANLSSLLTLKREAPKEISPEPAPKKSKRSSISSPAVKTKLTKPPLKSAISPRAKSPSRSIIIDIQASKSKKRSVSPVSAEKSDTIKSKPVRNSHVCSKCGIHSNKSNNDNCNNNSTPASLLNKLLCHDCCDLLRAIIPTHLQGGSSISGQPDLGKLEILRNIQPLSKKQRHKKLKKKSKILEMQIIAKQRILPNIQQPQLTPRIMPSYPQTYPLNSHHIPHTHHHYPYMHLPSQTILPQQIPHLAQSTTSTNVTTNGSHPQMFGTSSTSQSPLLSPESTKVSVIVESPLQIEEKVESEKTLVQESTPPLCGKDEVP